MNDWDGISVDRKSFAFRDLTDIDQWSSFSVSSTVSTAGTPTFTGRYRVVGKACYFEIEALASTSLAATSGTHYFALPIAAKGIGGVATMTNATANTAVGVCHIAVSTSRCYVPSQGASADTFNISGWYEIG